MSFNAANFTLMSDGNGFQHYRYDTLDALATVDGLGYINNIDDAQNVKVGDMVTVVVWATAIRTGTISDVGQHIVTQVNATTGDVGLSDDMTSWAPVSGD